MPVPPYKENERLLRFVRAGDQKAQETLYEMNRGLVHMVAEKFRTSGYDYEELFQIGSIGLIRAIRNFDPGYQVKFSTYAVPMILGEIRRFMRDDGMIHVQRSVKEKNLLIRRTQENLRRELGQDPTVEQIAQALQMEREEIVSVLEACQPPRYMEDLFSNHENNREGTLLDHLAAKENSETLLEKLSLQEALEHLPERERFVLTQRFFKEETQIDIRIELGISQVQVSRIEKNALKRLRQEFDV